MVCIFEGSNCTWMLSCRSIWTLPDLLVLASLFKNIGVQKPGLSLESLKSG